MDWVNQIASNWVALATVLAALLSGILGGFFAGSRQSRDHEERYERQLREHELTLKKPFYDEQLLVLLDLVDAASEVAIEYDYDKWCLAWVRFWKLYLGKGSIFESDKLDISVEGIPEGMFPLSNGDFRSPKTAEDLRLIYENRLAIEELAEELAYKVRLVLEKTWQAGLSTTLNPKTGSNKND